MRNNAGAIAAAGVLAVALLVSGVAASLTAPSAGGQALAERAAPQWEIDAGGSAKFDVASVKLNPASGAWHSNIALTEERNDPPSGNLFSATDVPLNIYIAFAYKTSARQTLLTASQLPRWALTARFDIEAKSSTQNPTKDQMRLMMQSLLVERFNLAVHRDTRDGPIYTLVLDKAGKTGPNLQPNSAGPACASAPAGNSPQPAPAKGLPAICGALTPLTPSAPGRQRMGVRGASMEQIAGYLAILGALDREVVDGTGLRGAFDFSVEWTPEPLGPASPNFQADASGPPFIDAMREQLGLKLRPATGAVDVLVIDRVEELTPN